MFWRYQPGQGEQDSVCKGEREREREGDQNKRSALVFSLASLCLQEQSSINITLRHTYIDTHAYQTITRHREGARTTEKKREDANSRAYACLMYVVY